MFGKFLSGSTTVGTTETRLIPSSLLPTGVNFCEVAVKTDATNTGTVVVGKTGLTVGTTAATDGFPFTADRGKIYECSNPEQLYTLASSAGQKIYWEIKYN